MFSHVSQEEPVIIKRKIELKYKVFGKKRSEDSTMNAGSLIVSAVFQPIESVSKSGEERKTTWYQFKGVDKNQAITELYTTLHCWSRTHHLLKT